MRDFHIKKLKFAYVRVNTYTDFGYGCNYERGKIMSLLGVNAEQTLKFFFEYLGSGTALGATQAETLYVAGILAYYARTSRSDPLMSPSGSLYDILDTFVLPGFTPEGSPGLQDPRILEIAGSQTLLLVGFFRDQMKKKHNLEWYDSLGCSFFGRASERLRERKKAALLRLVAQHFSMWAIVCCNMSRTLREKRYLLKL